MKKDNKGFSLVELIIVIAIMAVLIGVLAPTFIKYVERGRRSTDVQNAEEIKTAFEADLADGSLTGTVPDDSPVKVVDYAAPGVGDPQPNNMASTITEAPTPQANITNLDATGFYVSYNATTGIVKVYAKVGTDYKILTTPDGVEAYNGL